MFRRRGCLFGCSGMLLVCVVVGALSWFFVMPRVVDEMQEGLGESLSTVIADEVNPLYTRDQLQQGQVVEFPFSGLNQELNSSENDSSGNLDNVTVLGQGDEIVMSASINGQDFEYAFLATVTPEGDLKLEAVDADGWFQEKVMDILGGGFEHSVNLWLDSNGLILTDVSVDTDSLFLTVVGE